MLLHFADTSTLDLNTLLASIPFSSCLYQASVSSSKDSPHHAFNSKLGNLRDALNITGNVYYNISTIITTHIMKGMEKLIVNLFYGDLLSAVLTDKSQKPRIVSGAWYALTKYINNKYLNSNIFE